MYINSITCLYIAIYVAFSFFLTFSPITSKWFTNLPTWVGGLWKSYNVSKFYSFFAVEIIYVYTLISLLICSLFFHDKQMSWFAFWSIWGWCPLKSTISLFNLLLPILCWIIIVSSSKLSYAKRKILMCVYKKEFKE